ncbi:unnamed protein product [Cylicocyclus nassatus]|uniref:Uncharacterized protein n=1 Tax=Cylicocyclus nassatus TaxID=53992 RepID=A0AA36GXX5_CYLNA|nr:unnamed protein product [Cylicocyclus nassatus]
MTRIQILLHLCMASVYVSAKLGCKDMEGNDVDWFAVIKLPSDVDTAKGRSFVYFDPRIGGWTQSKLLISSNKSAIGATLSQLYKIDKKETFAIAYNDDSPDGPVESGRAHSKGVAVFDHDVGFWMVHSVPNFPPSSGEYSYPGSGAVYGQSFLCMSISSNNLEDVGQYMRYAQVNPYLTNLPEYHKILAPSLVDVVNKKSLPKSATVFNTIRGIETLGGMKLKAFSKHKKYGKDLWYEFIALHLNTQMAVETWRKGNAKNIGSTCDHSDPSRNVYDVNTVKILDKQYEYKKDHSKWGVSRNANVPAVCIGDINRQMSQYKRGGGAVCIEDAKLWEAFIQSVKDYDTCKIM